MCAARLRYARYGKAAACHFNCYTHNSTELVTLCRRSALAPAAKHGDLGMGAHSHPGLGYSLLGADARDSNGRVALKEARIAHLSDQATGLTRLWSIRTTPLQPKTGGWYLNDGASANFNGANAYGAS
jgi:hypothetical protein